MSFSFDITNPQDTALISTYPTNERAERQSTKSIVTANHEEATGNHEVVELIVQVGDPGAAGNRGQFYTKVESAITELFYRDDTGAIIQITGAGAIAPLAVLKAGDTMTGNLVFASTGDIVMGNNLNRITAETSGGGVFRFLAFLNATDQVVIGDQNEPLWLQADDKDGFIADFPGGPAIPTDRFMHEGNMGTGSLFDTDKVDGHEAEEVFSAAMTSGGGFFFRSVGQTVDVLDTATIAHSLTGIAAGDGPGLIAAQLKCISADVGHSVGDYVPIAINGGKDGNDRGFTIFANDTNVSYTMSRVKIQLFNPSTGNLDEIDVTKWELYLSVWK